MPDLAEASPAASCPDCGTPLAASALSCSNCHRLVHSETLKKVAEEAELAATSGDLTAALTLWRQALDLLPRESVQHEHISQRIVALSKQLDQAAAAPEAKKSGRFGQWGILGTALLFLATKGKLLLLGLSKATTILSMLASFGVYWAVWGWQFALGFVLCIYVHEMGHVSALRRYGIPATPPMFIPGLGALVRIKQYPATPSEDANVGLAGPLWGLGATCATYGLFLATGNLFFAALTHVSGIINVFNLLPLGSLDGGRGFRALSRPQRWAAMLVVGAVWYFTSEGILGLVGIVAFARCFGSDAPKEADRSALLKYMLLIVALTALAVNTEPFARLALTPPTPAAQPADTNPEQ